MWPRYAIQERACGAASTSGRPFGQQDGGQQRLAAGMTPRRACVTAQATSKQRRTSGSDSRRNSQLYELFEDDGWGVEVAGPSQPAAVPSKPAAAAAPQAQPAARKARQRGTPYVDMRSEEGVFGLTLLQKALLEQHEQATGEAPMPVSMDDVRAIVAAAQQSGSRKKPRLPGNPGSAAAISELQRRKQARTAGRSADFDDDDDDDEEDEEQQPEFQITFENGKAEMTDFAGSSSSSSGGGSAEGAAAAGLEGDLGFEGWEQFGELQDDGDEEDEDDVSFVAARAWPGSKRAKRQQAAKADEAEGELEAALLSDLSNEDDWGLEGLPAGPSGYVSGGNGSPASPRRSLLQELEAEEAAADALAEGSLLARNSSSVHWGGSAGATGLDLEEQEDLLRRYFKPSQVKKLMAEQVEVDAAYSDFRKRAVGLGASDKKTQEKLRIVSGTAAGRKLVSFRSSQTRPMMEKVRQAIFNMIQYQAGTVNCLPATARWLDLFAGTGSVGLEALSRGAAEAHFVEMDPVVVQRILSKNIAACGFKRRAWAHTLKAEDFLRKAAALPRFAGGPFDFVSVCPPYLLVSYPELFDLLDGSPLLHAGSIVFVEYPKQLEHEIRGGIGPLQRIKDRKYGRTYVAVYAAGGGKKGRGGDDAEEDPFLAMA